MPLSPFSHPLYVMAKPVGSRCNLACSYCYYLEKGQLLKTVTAQGQPALMSDETLELFTRQYLEAQTQPEVLFTWHGGEPLLRPLDFYRKALKLQRQYGRGRRVENCLQTNGTLLTDEWCRFFKEHNFLIGISIDGPEELHDAYRRTRGDRPSFGRVMRGIELLERHGVEWNAMGVVNALNAERPVEVYRFYRSIGAHYIQFTPIVERVMQKEGGSPALIPSSVKPGQFARFACGVFDEWVRQDVGTFFVQLFDATLARWVGEVPGVCSMAETCGHAAAIEAGGDLFACDHYVFPEYRLGNIHEQTIAAMMFSPAQHAFGQAKREGLPGQCRRCQWLNICNGGCPKDRFCCTPEGEAGLNYLCQDYRQFFEHVAPDMNFMANELRHERAPQNVMKRDR